jgi:hypothetical protein
MGECHFVNHCRISCWKIVGERVPKVRSALFPFSLNYQIIIKTWHDFVFCTYYFCLLKKSQKLSLTKQTNHRTYEVQTLRLSMNSFEEWVRPGETIECVREVALLVEELQIDFFNIGKSPV